MRDLFGYYPSSMPEEEKNRTPSRAPEDWGLRGKHSFDRWQSLGVAIVLPQGVKSFRLDGTEPKEWEFCWNPRDRSGKVFDSLPAFAAYYLLDDRPVGVEFYKWERGIEIDLDPPPPQTD